MIWKRVENGVGLLKLAAISFGTATGHQCNCSKNLLCDRRKYSIILRALHRPAMTGGDYEYDLVTLGAGSGMTNFP
jgi:hypothetical protein